MEYVTGEIYDGKVKSIAAFGAFITLPGGKTGMVHISEIAYSFVADIHQVLTEGQDVKVMVLSADPGGKINLSIKRTLPQEAAAAQRQQRSDRPKQDRPRQDFRRSDENRSSYQPRQHAAESRTTSAPPAYSRPAAPADQSFEDKLKAFMTESDSKISSIKEYSERRTKTRRR